VVNVLSTFWFRDYFCNLVVVVHVSLCNLLVGAAQCSPFVLVMYFKGYEIRISPMIKYFSRFQRWLHYEI